MSFRMSRRSLLRGIGGIAIALPVLEIMGTPKTAKAAASKKRFVSCYAGFSIGDLRKSDGGRGLVQPSTEGTNYEITTALQPLQAYNVKSLVGVVTGLKMATDGKAPGSLPGAPPSIFHGYTEFPQLAGCKIPLNNQGPPSNATTCDRVVAKALGMKTLNVRAQPIGYRGDAGGGSRGRMSFENGSVSDPYVSPHTLFQTMFAGLPTGGNVAPEVLAALDRRRSVLDLVNEEGKRLSSRLGAADKRSLDQHMALLRTLELEAQAYDPSKAAICKKPSDPGADPAGDGASAQVGYNGETERARLFADMIKLAFACDLVQSVAFQLTFTQCFISARKALGVNTDLDIHEMGHQAVRFNTDYVAKSVAWAVDPFARLIAGLRDTTDENNTRLIDNTALTLCFEGGWTPSGEAHSVEHMMVLYGGNVGGLKAKHVRGDGRHPAEVMHSAMKAVGVSQPLGDFTTYVDSMFT